jgi:methionine-rich copper-binding protein CopC
MSPPRGLRMGLRTGLARAALVAGLVGVVTFGAATAASAHNVLLRTSPANGSSVATLPANITLTFNEPALAIGSVMRVIGPGGDMASGPPVLVDRTVREAVRPGAPAGTYTVQWRVTSLDGHPISGQFSFTAAAGNGAPAAGSASAGTSAATAEATSAAVPQASGDTGSGSAKPLVLVLLVAGVLVVGAGVFLAIRRPGPTL